MTRRTNSRLAGFTFLFYIAAGILSLVLFGQATGGEAIAAKLAGISQHATAVRLVIVLGLFQAFSALVLAVTLHALTREQDPDLALLGLACRVGEGVIIGAGMQETLRLRWLATTTGANAPDAAAAHALGAFLLQGDPLTTATFFAVGSTLFAWLMLRGRIIPLPLAWIGVVASVLLVVGLPLQLAGVLRGPLTQFLWLPMIAFEVPLALWLLVKGAAAPAPGHSLTSAGTGGGSSD